MTVLVPHIYEVKVEALRQAALSELVATMQSIGSKSVRAFHARVFDYSVYPQRLTDTELDAAYFPDANRVIVCNGAGVLQILEDTDVVRALKRFLNE